MHEKLSNLNPEAYHKVGQDLEYTFYEDGTFYVSSWEAKHDHSESCWKVEDETFYIRHSYHDDWQPIMSTLANSLVPLLTLELSMLEMIQQ